MSSPENPAQEPLIPDSELPPDKYQGEEWWLVDHHDSDRYNHTYCGECRSQIPSFLTRWETRLIAPYHSIDGAVDCEGCRKVATHT